MISIPYVESLQEEGHSEGGSITSTDNIAWALIRILRPAKPESTF